MQTIEYRTKDKSSWPRGPWDGEPDKKQWQDPVTGLACLIVRNNGGALCGYVGLPPGHKFHGVDYDDVDIEHPHGGLTFASACSHGDESTGICHKPEPDESDEVWWLGFDCAQSGDLIPGNEWLTSFGFRPFYRDFEYVTTEVTALAARLA